MLRLLQQTLLCPYPYYTGVIMLSLILMMMTIIIVVIMHSPMMLFLMDMLIIRIIMVTCRREPKATVSLAAVEAAVTAKIQTSATQLLSPKLRLLTSVKLARKA